MGKWGDRGIYGVGRKEEKQEPIPIPTGKWSSRMGGNPGIEQIESPLAGEEGAPRYLQTETQERVMINRGVAQNDPLIPSGKRIARTPVGTGAIPADTKRASFGTLSKTEFVDKPETRIKILSKDMDIPEERFGVHKGQIVYLGKDNILYYATEQSIAGKAKGMAAGMVGHSPELVMGTLGSLAGPKGTIAGTLIGTEARRLIGKEVFGEQESAWKEAKDAALAAGTGYLGHKGGDIATAAIDRAKGAKGSRLLRFAGRDELRIDTAAVKELETLAKKHNIELFAPQATGSNELVARFNLLGDLPVTADKIGIARMKQYEQINKSINKYMETFGPDTLTAQSTGTAGVKASQKVIKTATKARSTAGTKAYNKAWDDFNKPVTDTTKLKAELAANTDKIAKASVKADAAPDMDKMVAALKRKEIPTMQAKGEPPKAYRNRIAKDYKQVTGLDIPILKPKDSGIDALKLRTRNADIKTVLAGGQPSKGSYIPTTVKKVDVSEAVKEVDTLMSETLPDDPSYKALKLIKKMMKDADGNPKKLNRLKISGIDSVLRKHKADYIGHEIRQVKKKLVGAMKKQVPGYERALKIWGDSSEVVKAISSKKGKVGKLAGLEGDEVEKVSKILFSRGDSSDTIIKRVKPQIIKNGGQEAWDNMIKTYLKQELHDVVGTNTMNIGGMFRKKVWVHPDQRKILMAAMSDSQQESFKDFMKLMESVGKTAGKESTTIPRGVSYATMNEEAQGRIVGKLKKLVSMPLYTPKRMILDFRTAVTTARYFDLLADAMISPKSTPQIKRMLKMNPRAPEFMRAMGVFMAGILGKTHQQSKERGRLTDRLPAVVN